MCYRTSLNSNIKKIEKVFAAQFISPEGYTPREEINAFDFLPSPVITDEVPGEIQHFNWGLIPFWAKTDGIKAKTLNAKIETASEKPSFRNSVNNRCLIIANGYYEWQWLDPKGKKKQKFFIKPEDQDLFAFAGLYSTWKDPANGTLINSYTILTTDANELMSEIHNNKKRMPVVLRKEDQNSWLRRGDLTKFAFPYEVELVATSVD